MGTKKYSGPNRRDVSARLSGVEAGLNKHEGECALRYKGIELNTVAINERLDDVSESLNANTATTNRIWWAIMAGGGATILLLAKLALVH